MFKLKLENTSSDPECVVGSSLDSAPWRQPELGSSGGQVLGQVSIGANASVWPMTVIRGDVHHIRIGAESNIYINGRSCSFI